MEHKLELLPSAWEDLQKIEDRYILLFDMDTALKVTDHILDAIERLEIFPESGSLLPDAWLNTQGYRMVIVKHHAAIYRKIEEVIYVYRTVDMRSEYTKLFYG